MKFKGLLTLCAVLVLSGTPLAAARVQQGPGGDVTAEATGPSGAIVNYDPGLSICNPGSGSLFALGDTPVTCLPDGSFTVHVVDTTGPSLTVSGNVAVSTTTPPPVVVNYAAPTANDLVDGAVTASCAPASGSSFGAGTTTVNCSASDSRGNGSAASFTVTVTVDDTTAPVISNVPANIVDTTTNPGGKPINYTNPTATDNIDGSVPVNCNPGSGSTFPVTTTTVNCTATDAHGNSSTESFTVTLTIVDTTAPVISNVPGNISETTTTNAPKPVSYANPTATDNVDGPVPVNCSPASGSSFPLTTTTVNCSATDAHNNEATASFTVTVTLVDTTPPTFSNVPGDISETTTVPGGKVVNFTKPTATDNLDGVLPASAVTCSPASGSTFPIGESPVTCSATDAHDNTGQVSFKVTITLVDTTKPVLSDHANVSTTTDVNASKVVTYTNPTATDNIDGPLPVTCVPASGSSFPIGQTTVNCSATDAHGNTGEEAFNVTVTLVDTTKPVLSGVPGTINQNTEVPSGKVVNYTTPTANDNVDGPIPVTCSKASGTNFVVGTTPVTCSATDAHGNKAEATFNVVITLVDITKPVLSNVPSNITTEANGPAGSTANFSAPTAVDNLDGPIATVTCLPASGSTFPLGATNVTCSATDLHGNTGSATFKVTVVDTTPPALVIPISFGIHATSAEGIPRTNPTIAGYLASASASDIVDPSPVVTNNAPGFLPIGTTDVTFTARDASGNGTSRSSAIVVERQPSPGTPPLAVPPAPKPPDNPKSVNGKPGNGTVKLVWTAVTGAKQYLVYRSQPGQRSTAAVGHGDLAYSGTATTFTDRKLKNGVEYRYVIVVEDAAGNRSSGIAIVVVPRLNLLRTPADGARLNKIPTQFVWRRDPRATYYNFQLFAGGALLFTSTVADPKKILSVFPTKPSYRFKSPWKWQGRRYQMTKGVYTWFVWPGYGVRADVNYGPIMGPATFQVTPAKKKPKKKR